MQSLGCADETSSWYERVIIASLRSHCYAAEANRDHQSLSDVSDIRMEDGSVLWITVHELHTALIDLIGADVGV